MKLCVIGVGGAGGYFGGKLAYAIRKKSDPITEIYFVARGKHLEMIKREGLILKTSAPEVLHCRPALATDHLEAIPDIDVLIIGVKGYDLDEVSRLLVKKIGEKTLIVPLLNGIDIRERLRKHIGNGTILPACVYVGSYIEEPGVVVQSGKPGKIILGPDPEHPGDRPDQLLQLFREASIVYDWEEDAYPAIWEKYIFIASFALVSARFDKTLGEIVEEDHLKDLVQSITEEIYRIAVAKKISLPPDVIDASMKKVHLFQRDTQTSLQRDMRQKKGKNELDLFGRAILDQGISLGIPTPVTKSIYDELLNVI